MNRLVLLVFVVSALSWSGCVVLPATTTAASKHPLGGPPGQAKAKPHEHPHGGPPGQTKHHMHSATCGHERVMHDGVWIYSVDGQWWRLQGETWVVVTNYHGKKGKKK